jgi:hypothetical protein
VGSFSPPPAAHPRRLDSWAILGLVLLAVVIFIAIDVARRKAPPEHSREAQAAPPPPAAVFATPIPYVTPTPRFCAAGNYAALMDRAQTMFSEDLAIAARTPRVSLAFQVARLTDERRQFEHDTQSAPVCAFDARDELVSWMKHSTESLAEFMADRSWNVAPQDEMAKDSLEKYKNARLLLER